MKELNMKLYAAIFRTLATVLIISGVDTAWASDEILPLREGPRPATTAGVPHLQIGVEIFPELAAKLLERVATIPGVQVRETVVSLPGAKGFWLNDGLDLAHPEVIVGGREFAHAHPNGSLHASLPPKLAAEAVNAGWAIHHPWANERPGWSGFVMIYTPTSLAELRVVSQLIIASYNFVTGSEFKFKDQ